MFQSTRPRGARRTLPRKLLARVCFNPRARVGRDLTGMFIDLARGKFQSTRPRGARLR